MGQARTGQTRTRGFRPRAAAGLAALALAVAGPALAQQGSGGSDRAGGRERVAEGLLARRGDGEFAPVRFDPAAAPLGLRQNNYVALKRPGGSGAWPGQTGADPRGYARFDDPAYAIRGFVELMRVYHDRYGARSALDIFRRYAPAGDCSGAPSAPAPERREGGGCPENEAQAPVAAVRAARAVGLRPEDDLGLFGRGGRVAHPERLRAVLDAVVSQEIGPPYCPQPPRGEAWLGCRVEDGLFRRALELLDRPG